MIRTFFVPLIFLVILSIGLPAVCFSEEKNDDIMLMFPRKVSGAAQKSAYQGPGIPTDTWYRATKQRDEYSSTMLSDFVKKFENQKYKVDQIELWIEFRGESGKVTQLFIALEGKGGCKVILKPRQGGR